MGTYGRLGRIAAIVILAATGVVAFATIAPSREGPLEPAKTPIVETLAIRLDATPAPKSYFREELFQRGDTLPVFMERLGIAGPQAARLAKLRAVQQLRPGTHVSAEVSAEGEAIALSFLSGRDTLIKIVAEANGYYRVTDDRAQLDTQVAMKSGVIRSSLFAATDDASIPDSIAMQLGDVFSGDVDFHRDLRKGDRFSVIYEMHYLGGRPVRAGRVLAAEFTNNGKTFRAVHFGNGYYAPDGKNLRKAFMRSPLEFSRVSSGFGMRRHPIAREWRKHRLRRANRHAGARSGRWRGRARRRQGRLRQCGHPAPPRPVRDRVRPSEPHQRAQGRARGAERHHRRGGPNRLGHRPAPALRIPRWGPGAQPVLDRDAGRESGRAAGPAGLPPPCRHPRREA
jgi:hypothetical protein